MTDEPRLAGAYVHRISKGHSRLFFNCSIPLTWYDPDEKRLMMVPDEVAMELAEKLTKALLPEARSP